MKELDKLIVPMEDLFKKLPPLPKGVKEFIVAVTPWLALIFGVLGLIGLLIAIGLFTFLSPVMVLGGGVRVTTGLSLSLVLNFLSVLLIVIAVPSLFSRKISGWNFVFLSEIVTVVSAALMFNFIGIVFSLVFFYVLFQIKSYYK